MELSKKSMDVKLLKLVKPFYKYMILCGVYSIIVSLATIYHAEINKNLFDSIVGFDSHKIVHFTIIFIIAKVILLITSSIRTYFVELFNEKLVKSIKEKTAYVIKNLEMHNFDRISSGSFITKVNDDTQLIREFFDICVIKFFDELITLSLSLTYIFWLNWRLAVVILMIVLLNLFVSVKLSKPNERLINDKQIKLDEFNETLKDSISGIMEIKSFVAENEVSKKIKDTQDELIKKELKIVKYNCMIRPINSLLYYLPIIIILGYGGYLLVNKEISFGALVVFISLVESIADTISSVQSILKSYRASLVGAKRVFEIIDLPVETSLNKAQVHNKLNEPIISFKNVMFSYDNEKDLIKNISFDIEKGEIVALVGNSGCGKSTIVKLISSLYSVSEGSIHFSGNDLKSLDVSILRKQIAVVYQDTYIFPESIYENISIGNSNISLDKVKAISKLVGLHEFIEQLPQKYNTIIGEKGIKLSGGQRQRVGIARALLKDSSIVLFDEPTSAQDYEAEQIIYEVIKKIAGEKTILIITHNLLNISNVDRIYVMNNGKIEESGNHLELIQLSRTYSEIYKNQLLSDIRG